MNSLMTSVLNLSSTKDGNLKNKPFLIFMKTLLTINNASNTNLTIERQFLIL